MSTMNIYDMADTWNDGATTFSAIKMNVTDTASASGSLLMDLQVGGVSQFQITKAARVNLGPVAEGLFWRRAASFKMEFGWNNSPIFGIASAGQFHLGGNLYFTSALDLALHRDAANTLAQRNGVNAQAFRVYNTFTDASNYERGVFDFTSVANHLTIGTEKAGTGATRIVRFVVGGTRVAISDGSYFQIDKDLYALGNVITAAKYTQMSEMTAPAAPAANGVRIYAEDDGTGKTRLMALFATGAAQQIAIEP